MVGAIVASAGAGVASYLTRRRRRSRRRTRRSCSTRPSCSCSASSRSAAPAGIWRHNRHRRFSADVGIRMRTIGPSRRTRLAAGRAATAAAVAAAWCDRRLRCRLLPLPPGIDRRPRTLPVGSWHWKTKRQETMIRCLELMNSILERHLPICARIRVSVVAHDVTFFLCCSMLCPGALCCFFFFVLTLFAGFVFSNLTSAI